MAKWKLLFVLFAVLSLCSNSQAVDLAQFDRGHRILLQRGLQIQATTTIQPPLVIDSTYLTAWDDSGFTTPFVNFGQMSIMPEIPDSLTQWGLAARGGEQYPSLVAAGEDIPGTDPLPISLASRMVNICYNDEQLLTDPVILADTVAHLAQFRNQYPNTISYTSQWGSMLNYTQMRAYMSQAQPDMLMHASYPWLGSHSYLGGSPTETYKYLQVYRQAALLGNDGTGNTPIPYGRYLEGFTYLGDRVPSESEINLNHYSSWALGYTVTNAFTYDHAVAAAYPFLFERSNPFGPSEYNNPTDKFDEFAEINQEGQNLGPTLVRLLSTDFRMIMGIHKIGNQWYANATPSGLSIWDAAADPYITSISANNPGTENEGGRGDVAVGYFKPLHEDFDGAGYTDELYFMIVNGLTTPGLHTTAHDGSGADCQQEITLNFDFGATGITELQRVNRSTGAVEIVPLNSLGGSLYDYVLTLDGGEGDLFKFNTGAPFILDTLVTIQGDVNGDWLVNFDDATIIIGNAGMGSPLREHGDLDGDGNIDADDLQEVKDNWGTGYPGAPLEPPEMTIPEPSTLALLMVMGSVMMLRGRPKGHATMAGTFEVMKTTQFTKCWQKSR